LPEWAIGAGEWLAVKIAVRACQSPGKGSCSKMLRAPVRRRDALFPAGDDGEELLASGQGAGA
jgi:hypothetical protein